MHLLHYSGSGFFRQRVLLATLTGRPIRISSIREDSSESPGLKPYEASLLRLLCAVTSGSRVHIDPTGTVLTYTPGQLAGADPESPVSLKHVCHPGRGISYYLETLLLLAPFCKNPLTITLLGVTDGSELDCSVDVTRSVTVPTLQKILGLASGGSYQPEGGPEGEQGGGGRATFTSGVSFQVKVVRRGFSPKGAGEVHLRCSGVLTRPLQPFALLDVGRVKRVRGIAFAENVSPILARRCITKIRQIFNDFLPDVWVYLDAPSKKQGQAESTATGGAQQTDKDRRGVGVALVAETIKGNFKGASAAVIRTGDGEDNLWHKQKAADASRATGNSKLRRLLEEEEKDVTVTGEGKGNEEDESELIGEVAARRLLLEIEQGGVVDSSHQYMALLFAAAADEYQPSKVRLSQLTPYTTQFIRHIRDFLGVTFHFEYGARRSDSDSAGVILKCVGAGLRNTARKTF